MRTTEIGAWTPPSGTTPGMRRPVRTITLPPISSRRIRFGRADVVGALGRDRRRLQAEPGLAHRRGRLVHDLVLASRGGSRARGRSAASSSSSPITSGASTRSASSSSSCPVSSPSSTTIVFVVHRRRMLPAPSGTRLAWHEEEDGDARVASGGSATEDSRGKRDHRRGRRSSGSSQLVIPPAWKDVWISPRAGAKLQATGVDRAGRRQYLYHPDYRAQQEQAKFDKLVRFAERLPELRKAMAEHMDARAARLANASAPSPAADQPGLVPRRHGALREDVPDATGSRRCARATCRVRGSRITFQLPRQARGAGAHGDRRRRARRGDARSCSRCPAGAALPLRATTASSCNLTGARLNDYIREHMGEEFTAKDFRTWGGTLIAAIALAEHGAAGDGDRGEEARRGGHARGRRAARKHAGRCARVVRQPGGRRAVSRRANDRGFPATAFARRRRAGYRSRSAKSRRCSACCVRGEFDARARPREFRARFRYGSTQSADLRGGKSVARKTVLVCDNCGTEIGEGKGATMRINFTDARRGVEAGRSLRRLRRQDAGPGGRAARPPAEVRRLADGVAAALRAVPAHSRSEPQSGAVGPQVYDGSMASDACSPGRRTRARSRCCSSATSARSTAIRS